MKKYNLIYADPPWQYSNQSTRAATKNHYPTLKTQSIKKLPIPKIADDNSVLAIRHTSSFDRQKVIGWDAWGNEYKNDIELGGNQLCKIN